MSVIYHQSREIQEKAVQSWLQGYLLALSSSISSEGPHSKWGTALKGSQAMGIPQPNDRLIAFKAWSQGYTLGPGSPGGTLNGWLGL